MSSEVITIKSPSHRKQQSAADRFGLLYTIERQSISQLITLFNEIFDELEESLLSASNRATNNHQQSYYFGFIKELQQQRTQAQNRFRHYLTQNFRALNTAEKQLWKSSMMDLYSIEELELEVAINNIVTKARCAYPRPLLHLMTRLNTLIPQAKITSASNPLGPKQIVSSFVIAVSPFQFDTTTRLQIINKFEQLILESFGSILSQANQTLIDAGYHPNINALEIRSFYLGESYQQEPAQTEEPDSSEIAHQDDCEIQQEEINDEVVKSDSTPEEPSEEIAPLVVEITAEATEPLEAIEADPEQASAESESTELPYIQQGQLFKLLDYLQQRQLKTPLSISPLQIEPLVSSLLQENEAHEARQLSPRDYKIFHLMDLSFGFIYSQGLPTGMAVLIAQLQIPLLKVAIYDPSFLKSRNHPARRLINLIANSGISWESPKNDDIYQAVRDIVNTLANEFYGDPKLLETLAGTLVDKLEAEQQRAQRLEQRVIELEQGKAKTEQSRQQIKTMLEDRMQGKRLPAAVIEFIQQNWQPTLLQARLKHGATSQQMKEALNLTDKILSISQKLNSTPKPLVEALIFALSNYLSESNSNQHQASVALKDLQQALQQSTTNSELVEFDALSLDIDTTNQPIVHTNEEIDPIVLQDLRHQINALRTNTWFEFKGTENNAAPNRCKLVALLPDTDSLVFTNRFGQRTFVIKKEELALALYTNQTRPIITGLLMDRALKTAMSEIRAKELTPEQI